jgi:hypothetical protein
MEAVRHRIAAGRAVAVHKAHESSGMGPVPMVEVKMRSAVDCCCTLAETGREQDTVKSLD